MPDLEPAIGLEGITKRFGPVLANDAVTLEIAPGTVHGLVGENGAGKSTLMSVLYGFYEPDAGAVTIHGKPLKPGSSQAAIAAGIGMVHQHFMLVETMSVIENVMLGNEPGWNTKAGSGVIRRRMADMARDYGLSVDPDAIVGDLPVGLQQRVEIIKTLMRDAEILILDEPTAVLTPEETNQLFEIIRLLKARGKTIIIVTHKLREIMAVTDNVTVMRRGRVVTTLPTASTSPAALAEAMVGRPVRLTVARAAREPGKPLLEVENLTIRDASGHKLLNDVSLTIRAGEILGIAGVTGSGQGVLLAAIAGLLPVATGRIRLGGHDVTGETPHALREAGLHHIPEDRQRAGLVMAFEESESAILGWQDEALFRRGPLLSHAAIRADAEAKLAAYDVRPPDCRLKTANFSGGNQQKIVLAREIEREPSVLLVGQPSRGVDIGAIEFIHQRLIALRDAGKAILLVSVELEEILALSDRILVMCGGRVTGERRPEATDERDLGLLMAGVTGEAA